MLWRAKLSALVRRQWGLEGFDAEPRSASGGVVAQRGDVGWMLAEEEPGRAVGRGLLWALRSGVRELHLIVSGPRDGAVRAARRGQSFQTRIAVWSVHDAGLVAVSAEGLASEPPLDVRARPYREMIVDAGAEPVVEWGALYGDVWGLEVTRVNADGAGAWLEIGVGKQDRLVHRMMLGDEPPQKALAEVVHTVRQVRQGGGIEHPLNQLARERWLRAWLVRNPDQIKARILSPVTPPVARSDPRAPLLAPALARDEAGQELLVACSVGFDTELVPMAAELQAAAAARSGHALPLVLCLPERHDHSLLRLQASDVVAPVSVALVPDDWPLRCQASTSRSVADRPPRPESGITRVTGRTVGSPGLSGTLGRAGGS